MESNAVSAILARALDLHARGDLEAAASAYEVALTAQPDNARLVTQLGLLRLQQGRYDDSEGLLRHAASLDSAAPEPRAWLGELFRRQNRVDEAIDSFHQSLRLRRDYAPAWFNLGLAYTDAKRLPEAQRALLDFLRLRPMDKRVRRELGVVAFERRQFDEALHWFTEQMRIDPTDMVSRCDLAAVHLRMRKWREALQVLSGLEQVASNHSRLSLLFGQALYGQGRTEEAASHLATAASLDPMNVDAVFDLALANDRMANLESAIRGYEAASRLAPSRADYIAALATAELNLGELQAAISHYRAAVELNPKSPELHSALLMAMHYIEPDHGELLNEHRRWATRHAAAPPLPSSAFENSLEANRRLRIGYLSPRFGRGPLAHFFLPVLRAHDSQCVEVYCYMVSTERDAITDEMAGLCQVWRDVAGSTDADLVETVRRDRIDILVDLAGHCPGNRLGVFAKRAAPIQISWLDYDDTTGVPAMDYYLSDHLLTPPSGHQMFTETVLYPALVRAPHVHTSPLPQPGGLPARSLGYVTFGCINRISKLGPGVISTWAALLNRLPQSRLLLQATAFASSEPKTVISQRFASQGVDPSRLVLLPFSDEATMLRTYQRLDIALDPFPYNGCNTTCDALSMGVPVVSLEGTTLSGRHGAALLTTCGLHDWITHSTSEYVNRAYAAATDLEALAELRQSLPSRFLDSPICDGAGFTKKLERLYAELWTRWSEARRSGDRSEA